MNNYKISNSSFAFCFVSLLNSTLLGLLIPYLIENSGTSIFASLLISFIVGFFIIWVFFKIFNFLPNEDIFGKIRFVFPKCVSKIFNVGIFLLVFFMLIIIFFRLSTFIASEFLAETPNCFIAIILSLPLLYLCFYDFEVISRLGVICASIGFFILIFNVGTLLGSISIDNFKPFISSNLLESGVVSSFVYIVPSFLVLAIPKSNVIDNNKTFKYVLVGYLVSFVSLVGVFFATIGVLGVSVSKLYMYPSYVALKSMNVFGFVQNIENFNILIWVLFMTFSSSFCLLFLKSSFVGIFNVRNINVIKYGILSVFFVFMFLVLVLLKYESYINRINYIFIIFLVYFSLFVVFLLVYVWGKIVKMKKTI